METQPLKQTTSTHANNFNFLRFALASCVIVSHSFELRDYRDPFGYLFGYGARLGVSAVSGFFLISGFLIVSSWQRSQGLGSYLTKRCLRIYPGFLVAFLISLLVVGRLGGTSDYWSRLSMRDALVGLTTLGVPSTPEVFRGQVIPIVNGSLWTIRYEFLCYLIVAALGLLRCFNRPRLVLALTGLLLAAYVAQVRMRLLGFAEDQIFLTFLSPLIRLLSCFMVGACVQQYPIRFTAKGSAVAVVIFLIASRLGFVITQTAIPLAGGYILFALANAPSRLMRSWNQLPDISYGLYLYAWPIQVLLIQRFPTIHPVSLCLFSFIFSAVAGAASWYGVERWFVQSRRNKASRTVKPQKTVVSCLS